MASKGLHINLPIPKSGCTLTLSRLRPLCLSIFIWEYSIRVIHCWLWYTVFSINADKHLYGLFMFGNDPSLLGVDMLSLLLFVVS